MWYQLLIVLLLLKSGVSADPENYINNCTAIVTDIKNESVPIDLKVDCASKPCIAKCCGENEVFAVNNNRATCMNIDNLKTMITAINIKKFNLTFNYSKLKIYKSNIAEKLEISSKKIETHFKWVRNSIFSEEGCSQRNILNKYILETGTLSTDFPNYYTRWVMREAPNYCVELLLKVKNKKIIEEYVYKFPINSYDSKAIINLNFSSIAMLISSFFLALVLVVYSLIPRLQNLEGFLLMAYVVTLMVAYLLKGVLEILSNLSMKKSSTCSVMSPIIYFGFLSSFFWLNASSFKLWRDLKRMRLCQAPRHTVRVKMILYSLYGWGIPAAMTTIVTVIDNAKLPPDIFIPHFEACMFYFHENFYYLYLAIIILTLLNCILFAMTMYNFWISKRYLANAGGNKNINQKKNKKNQSNIKTHLKISLLMGVSWILEVCQMFYKESLPSWFAIPLNAFNMLIGVVFFVLFICKKTVIADLCKRFNITNKFVREYTLNSSSKESASRPPSKKPSIYKTKDTIETDVELSEV